MLSEKLKSIRKQKGKTLKEVASEIGLTISAYSNYEQGLREPSVNTIKKICHYFDISADYLLEMEDEAGRKTYNINNDIHHNNIVNINQSKDIK